MGSPAESKPSATAYSPSRLYSSSLNVQVPPVPAGRLLQSLLLLWPQYATYVASFITIGIMWLNHHALFSRIHRVDRPLILLNLLLLMVVAFLPFPTEVLGRNINSSVIDGQIWALACLAIALGVSGVFVYIATHPELISPRFAEANFMGTAVASKAGSTIAIGKSSHTCHCLRVRKSARTLARSLRMSPVLAVQSGGMPYGLFPTPRGAGASGRTAGP
jgi:uncharacterized membrane protein